MSCQSSRRGPCHVTSKNLATSGEWRWGDRKVGGGARVWCSTPLHCGRNITVTVEQDTSMWARRVGSRMEGEKAAIQEEDESSDFLFLFLCGWQCCLLGLSGVETHQRASGWNGRPTDSIIVKSRRDGCCCMPTKEDVE